MHYVDRGNEPEKLRHYREKYTRGWIDYYNESLPNAVKPSDNYWTNNSIRNPLKNAFENNCGYCGRAIPIHIENGKPYPKGEVDHHQPKSKYPGRVYDWDNYIWSCHECNQHKGESYDEQAPLFNPCVKVDPAHLELRNDGRYYLKKAFEENLLLQKRYRATERDTLINTDFNINERKYWLERITEALEVLKDGPALFSSEELSDYPEKIQSYLARQVDEYQKQVQELNKILALPQYKKMKRTVMQERLAKNNELAAILEKEGLMQGLV